MIFSENVRKWLSISIGIAFFYSAAVYNYYLNNY